MSHFAVLVLSRPGQRVDALLLPYMENCCAEPPIEYMEFHEDDECDVDERTGRRGYWQNPNARWDWFVVGGRFSGRLRAPRGERGPHSPVVRGRYDVAEMRDVDTSRDWTEYRAARDLFDRLVAGEIDELDRWYSRDMALRRFGDAETYARSVSDFWFRAVVTPDGKWHEVGEMGWWGISSEGAEELREWIERFRERFVEPYLDCIATVVDCHI